MHIKKYIKVTIFFLSLLPILIIFYQIIFNQLGPEPVKEITHVTGNWTLRFIIITLAMTPLQKLTKFNFWISYRRMFGLFVFFYASAHMMTYVGIDYRFDWSSIGDDIVKKKFIFAGFLAWLLLVPLALTSSKRMIRILKDKWKKLHKLIYIISLLGITHYLWLVKVVTIEPLIYLTVIVILLVLRIKMKFN
ncbi:sulfite oxidase heme-binding subunit YedZ [Candidatus Pelagibacter sp. Uisw_134_02]|uniref:sulfite oxidase heme-binding subunit YedZ n=1 Tax=Candidatus Pelagibacter sp. Uisw_134_02 TaxID=3230990 RepID=UPI0039ED020A